MRRTTLRAAGLTAVSATLACAARADWPFSPDVNVKVADRPLRQHDVKIAPARDGSAYLGWRDMASANNNAFLQRIGPHGGFAMGEFGARVSNNLTLASGPDWDLAAERWGNAITVVSEAQGAGPGVWNIVAHRVSPTGAQLWGDAGVSLSLNANIEIDPRCVHAPDLSIEPVGPDHSVFVWARLPAAPGPFTLPPGLVMQRLTDAGVKTLGPGGVVIAGDGVEVPARCEIIRAGNQQEIVAWVRDLAAPSGETGVRVQMFGFNGQPWWNGGSPVEVFTGAVRTGSRLRLALDDWSGCIVAWESADGRTLVQRFDEFGAAMWPIGGVPVAVVSGATRTDPALAFDRVSGDAVIAFREVGSGGALSSIRLQRITAAGERALGDGGAVVVADTPGILTAPEVHVPPQGGAIVVSTGQGAAPTDRVVSATGVGVDGATLWGPTRLSPLNGERENVRTCMAGSGVVRAIWEGDTRIDPDGGVYAQNVNPNGTLGACAGDGTYDGVVNFADLNAVLSNFGHLFPVAGDSNADGMVNFSDLNDTLGFYGHICAP